MSQYPTTNPNSSESPLDGIQKIRSEIQAYKAKVKCGGLSFRECVGLKLINAVLASTPNGVNLSSPAAKKDQETTVKVLLELIQSTQEIFEEAGFAGAGVPVEADGALIVGTENGEKTIVPLRNFPMEYGILLRVLDWWRAFTDLDAQNDHPHFECCIYPIVTRAFGFPDLETSDGSAVIAAKKAGIKLPRDRHGRRDLILDIFQELNAAGVEETSGLYYKSADGKTKYDINAFRDFLKKKERRDRLNTTAPVSLDASTTKDKDALSLSKSLEDQGTQLPVDDAAKREAMASVAEALDAVKAVAAIRRAEKPSSQAQAAVREYIERLLGGEITLAEIARLTHCDKGELSRAYALERSVYAEIPQVKRYLLADNG